MLVAIATAIWGALKWAFTASTMAAFAARTAILMAASYAINAALTPTVRDPAKGDGLPLGGQTTESMGGPIPMHYGVNRVSGNIVAHYTSIDITRAGPYLFKTLVTRHILACFGEGPVPTLDLTTLQINGRPLTDVETMAAVATRGLVDQSVLSGWKTFKQDYNIGQTCVYDEPITYTFDSTGWTSLTVHIAWPEGLVRYNDDGAHHASVGLKIEVGDAIADTWQTIYDTLEYGLSSSPLRCDYDAAGSYTGGTAFTVTAAMQPRVRVTRTTEVPTATRYVTGMEFAAIQVGRPIGFTHPGMVLVSLSGVPKEVTAGGVTELSVESQGRIVSDEDGNWAATQSHADIVRDILTQPVVEGVGSVGDPYTASYYRGVDPSLLIGAGWAAQKTLAATTAPDGLGGTEALLQCDIIFDASTSVHSAVGEVCATGRCGLDYRGRYFGLWVDSARTPVGLLCDGTWERNSAELVPIEADQLASEATIRFRNSAADYADRTIQIIDNDFDTLVELTLDLRGVTRASEAARLGRRELARNWQTDLSVSCRTNIYGAVYEPGDVVYAQIDGRSIGGRIVAVSGRTVTFDRPITEVVSGGDVLIVQSRDPATGVQAVELHDVATVDSATQVTIDEDWMLTPLVGDPFLFGTEDIEDDQFEITAMALGDHLFASLSGTRYVPALDTMDTMAPGVPIPADQTVRVNAYAGIRKDDPAATVSPHLQVVNSTESPHQTKTFQEYFQDPQDTVAERWIDYAGHSAELSITTGGVCGTNVLQIGDNSGNDEALLVYGQSLPFDPGVPYRMHCRVKRTAGSGTIHVGVAGLNADDAEWVNKDGDDLLTSQYWVAIYNAGPADWTEYTGYIRGVTDTPSSANYAPDPSEPMHLHTNVRWMRPMILANDSDQAGTFLVDEITIEPCSPPLFASADTAGAYGVDDTEKTVQTLAVDTQGETILILFGCDVKGQLADETFDIELYVDSVSAYSISTVLSPGVSPTPVNCVITQRPASGSHTITLAVTVLTSGNTGLASHRYIHVTGLT